ncbi:hypothetical protein [Halobacterium hubeiense]|uniref:hypothetical protein n=1 Tax=Halobacterium hubeiense TaxID=1407499 RepID=UPI003C795725
MQRRKFIAGMGSLAAAGAAGIGTGAFSSVSANRDVSVSVVGDGDAYLRMVPDGSQYASLANNGELTISFDSLNANATSEFYDVFAIQNKGDQNIALFLDDGNASAQASTEGSLKGTIEPNLEQKGISFGIYNDGQSDAGQPNGAVALPSNYPNNPDMTFSDSNPYVLTPGEVFRPDMYFKTDGDDAGTSVSGTLRVLGFTKEWVTGPVEKGP